MTLRTTHLVGAVAAAGRRRGGSRHVDAPLVRDRGGRCRAWICSPSSTSRSASGSRGRPCRSASGHSEGDPAPRRGSSSTRRASKRAVVSVTCGVPGVVAAHTPGCLLPRQRLQAQEPAVQADDPAGRAAAMCRSTSPTSRRRRPTGTEAVRCRWAWTADGTWHAPDYPRLFFAKSQVSLPVLYKLYVVHPLGDEDLTKMTLTVPSRPTWPSPSAGNSRSRTVAQSVPVIALARAYGIGTPPRPANGTDADYAPTRLDPRGRPGPRPADRSRDGPAPGRRRCRFAALGVAAPNAVSQARLRLRGRVPSCSCSPPR